MEKGNLITLGNQSPASRLVSNSPSYNPIQQCTHQSFVEIKQQKIINQKQGETHFLKAALDKEQYVFLFMATVIDTCYLESKIKIFQEKLKSGQKLCLPSIYFLMEEYQKVYNRSYSEDLKFYIAATFWDQKLANVGTLLQWNSQMQQEIRRSQNYGQLYTNFIRSIDQFRDQQIQKATNDIIGKKKQRKQSKYSPQYTLLTPELVELIQSIEHQYYREKITFEQLIHKIQQQKNGKVGPSQMIEEIATQIFNKLDNEKLGYILFQKFYNFFLVSKNGQQKVPSIVNVQKVLNNIHEYDKHKNVVIPAKINDKSFQINLQNIIQLFLRILPLSKKVESLRQSETFKSIKIFLQKYQHIKKGAEKRVEEGERKNIENRNQQLEIVATMEYIRQAATTIIYDKIRRIQPLNIEKDYITQKKPEVYQPNVEKTDIKRPLHDNSIINSDNRSEYLRNRRQSNLNEKYLNNLASTAESKICSTGLKVENYSVNSPKSLNISNSIKEKGKYGSWPLSPNEDSKLKYLNMSKKNQIERRNLSYDNELQQVIENEMKIIQLQKLKNRVKYFNLIYQ